MGALPCWIASCHTFQLQVTAALWAGPSGATFITVKQMTCYEQETTSNEEMMKQQRKLVGMEKKMSAVSFENNIIEVASF